MKFNISKEHARCSGIYIIRNTINHKVYVGSAKNIYSRFKSHHSSLLNKKHSQLFQNFANKYGVDCLYMELLELVPDVTKLIEREQIYIDLHDSSNRLHGFNTNPLAKSRLGAKASEQTLQKRRGIKMSAEAKQKMSLAKLGKPSNITEEGMKRRTEKAKLFRHTPESLHKITISRLGEKNSSSKVSEQDVLKIRQMYHTMSYGAIAKHFAITHLNVRHIVKGNTWAHLPLEDYSNRQRKDIEFVHRKIMTSKGTILTDSDVLNIKMLYYTCTHKQIAQMYGLDRRQVGNMINGITWKHLPVLNYKARKPKNPLQLAFHL